MRRRRRGHVHWTRLSQLVVCLPLLALMLWYTQAAYSRFHSYRAATGKAPSFDLRIFHLFLHDEVHRHVRRFTIKEAPKMLDLFELQIPNAGTKALREDIESEGRRRYVDAHLRRGKKTHQVRLRLQGRRHWHHLGVQKSMKVRAKKGDLIDGLRTFNLLNDVTPFGLEEQLVLDVARSLDLLTPDYRSVRVRLNNTDMGVFRLVGAPDEGLLRRHARMPGSLYSGRFDRACPQDQRVGEKPCGFAKLGAREAADRGNLSEVLELHDRIHGASFAAFQRFAETHLDLDRFARFEALDIVFGGDQHDEGASLKLYFDPYRGRFEPVAMDFRAFRHDRVVHLADGPLFRRLKTVPGYFRRLNRWIHRLSVDQASPAEVRARADRWFERLAPELQSDPYWDAYKLLPKGRKFYRLMVRPMNVSRWLRVSRVELATQANRGRFLLDRLDEGDLQLALHPNGAELRLSVTLSGRSAYRLEDLTLLDQGRCRMEAVLPDGRREPVGDLAPARPFRPTRFNLLDPVVELRAVPAQTLQTEPVPTRFDYRLSCTEPPQVIELTATNLITDRVRTIRVATSTSGTGTTRAVSPDAKPDFKEGMRSPHPWLYDPPPPPQRVSLGPGVVEIAGHRRFGPETEVEILPDTTLRMGPGATLTMEGRVTAVGLPTAPIRMEPKEAGQPFGAVRLLGPGTAGSRLSHIRFLGGSAFNEDRFYTPGFLSIYDTRDITLSHLSFRNMADVEDVLHVTYVDNLTASEIDVLGAPTDGMDLERVSGRLRRIKIRNAGDECLDLMTAKLTISDSILIGCKNNAVSAGEETHALLDNLFIARSKVGLLSKNASRIVVGRSVFHEIKTALKTNKKEIHYDVSSRIEADELHVHDTKDLKRQGKKTKISLSRSTRGLPGSGDLLPLRRDVIGLSAWDEDALRARVTALLEAP